MHKTEKYYEIYFLLLPICMVAMVIKSDVQVLQKGFCMWPKSSFFVL